MWKTFTLCFRQTTVALDPVIWTFSGLWELSVVQVSPGVAKLFEKLSSGLFLPLVHMLLCRPKNWINVVPV